MKRIATSIVLIYLVTSGALASAIITYDYDKQHRLTEASYSATEKVFYSYDAAGNMDMYVSIDDAQYLKSFMLYLAEMGKTFKLGDYDRLSAAMQGQIDHILTRPQSTES